MLYLSYIFGILSFGILGYLVEIDKVLARIVTKIKQGIHAKTLLSKSSEDQIPTSDDIAQMLDVLILSLSAGLSFDCSVGMYCERFDNRLSHDLDSALFSWQIGAMSRVEALNKLSQTYNDPSFERFVQCVVESIELGSPIAQTLQQHVDVIRQSRRFELEERIEKLPIKILIPLTTLILPAMLLAILGPIFAGIFN